ncbi:hypothetical protein A2634_03850 [Candidatus Amesbacteria bacterium RIFCSPHIGHO2_01_FULL_48_32]|uniref:Undecaprenyldiphospho-muramoylpentapeptide beta-N-acetylglucosaminyltransferase n=1 Tax=Candidatus Amesbacteria bacterium RIFCSPLOWO2_01_FULL_48_25 TaxID=1797259 RepID=A0A1F4ZAS9_9BACT|nr:MAG: hypothetical protein A2634_03850 [Candidatus Amesbacteria bacterium RIFCSPHIGHO2_01_FULL_48_32]OGD03489.1 MAG: hypothetical protein A2989_02580 [Candidatus Amesbacteria bacterium RIFCSPLOWO2_01_FULL_48_25]HJZ05797.1 glycosyltransferase [Patescibacteria group bacterium]
MLVFTGGHHTSALEVAKSLQKQGYFIIWFGHRHSMWGDQANSAEYLEVTSQGVPFYDLQAGKFYHTFHPLKLLRLPWGFIQAFYWLAKIHPKGIVSFGGYLAVPTVICGWLLGIPSITHEQTPVFGWANSLIALFVKKIALTWPQSLSHYPKSKAVLTGLPIRPEILKIAKNKLSTSHLALRTIYITGGKQGSHILNQTVFDSRDRLLSDYKIIHQTGSHSHVSDFETAASIRHSSYSYFDYDSQKAVQALRSADVVVSRAGAHTTYELGLLGKRCVLIPLPYTSNDEQIANAKILESANLAVILPQEQLQSDSLISAIESAMKLNPVKLNLPKDGLERLVQLIKQELA